MEGPTVYLVEEESKLTKIFWLSNEGMKKKKKGLLI